MYICVCIYMHMYMCASLLCVIVPTLELTVIGEDR